MTAEVQGGAGRGLDVFRSLGATVEEVRMRPAQDYYDVKDHGRRKRVMAYMSRHCVSAWRFRRGFSWSRSLGALLFSGRRLRAGVSASGGAMIAEMKPIYQRYDVLISAAGRPGTAAGCAANDRFLATGVSDDSIQRDWAARRWRNASASAEAACRLSMQIVGRPFDEATVLRAAHAYEQATQWRSRRPKLDPAASFSTELPPVPDPEKADVNGAIRDRAAAACRAAGFKLTDRQFAMVCCAAPYVEAMIGRLYRERDWVEEPANIFQFGREAL